MVTTLPTFVLASTSGIRRKILDQAGLQYECVKPLREEPRAVGFNIPEEYVKVCARQKASEISEKTPNKIICGCDQTVFFESQILNKVHSTEECVQRLVSFSGKTHQLVNGLSIYKNGKEIHYHAETITIKMRHCNTDQIRNYVQTEQPLSSVACYFLEGKGIQLIQNIEGSFFTALGLPLLALIDFLTEYQKGSIK